MIIEPGNGLDGLQADLGLRIIGPRGLMFLVAVLQLGERAFQGLHGMGQVGLAGFGDAIQGLVGAEV